MNNDWIDITIWTFLVFAVGAYSSMHALISYTYKHDTFDGTLACENTKSIIYKDEGVYCLMENEE